MKIYEFKGTSLGYWIPKRISINGRTHFNLRIGTYAKGFWEFVVGIADGIVDLGQDPKPLKDEYYLINVPSKKTEGGFLEDKAGNSIYYINEIVGHCDQPECMLGLTLTSKSVLGIEICDDAGIGVMARYKQKINDKMHELSVYIFKEGDELLFKLTTKEDIKLISIKMKKGVLVLEKGVKTI